jgi:hypothetical protein
LLDDGGVGHGFAHVLLSHNDRCYLRRNPLSAVAGRTGVDVGGIIETAFGARHAEA